MKAGGRLFPFVLILMLAVIAMGLWLFEILEVKGWYSLDWLNGSLYSYYISTFLAALSFMVPFILKRRVSLQRTGLVILVLYGVNLICFKSGEQLCYMLYCRYCNTDLKDVVLLFSAGFLLYLFFGLAYWFILNRLAVKIKILNVLYIALFALMAIPLSFLSVHLLTGFGTGTEWVDAVKMGYPVFWTTLMLGLSAIIIDRKQPQE